MNPADADEASFACHFYYDSSGDELDPLGGQIGNKPLKERLPTES